MNKILISYLGVSLLLFSLTTQAVELDEKLTKYHKVLLKRPQSIKLFEKFQNQFLATYTDNELNEYLEKSSLEGGVVEKQLYAIFLTQRGDDNEALEVLNSANEIGANKQVLLERARVQARVLNFDLALIDLKKALELNEDDERFELAANKLIGRYLLRQGNADAAITHWKKLAAANLDDQELVEDVIDILAGDGLFKPALKHAKKLKENTKDPYKKALRTLRVGDLMQKMGERDQAVEIYQETLKLSGEGSWLEREIIAQIEGLFNREDNLQGLKEKLEALSKLYPQRLQITQKLADTHSNLGSHKEARELYLEIIKRSPDNKSLKKSLLQALEKAQDYKASKSLIESMLKISPDDLELYVKLAEVFDKLAQKSDAFKALQTFKDKADKNVANALRHANLVRKLQNNEETFKVYVRLVQEFPNSEEVCFVTSEYFNTIGKKDEAMALWQKLAKSESIETISRLLESLLFYNEHAFALELVHARLESLKTNLTFTGIAIKVSQANKESGLEMKLCERALLLASSPIEIDNAVTQLSRVLVKYKKLAVKLEALEKTDNLTTKQVFLKANLHNRLGEEQQAEDLIAMMKKTEDVTTLLQVVRLYENRYELDKAAEVLETIVTLPKGVKPSYLKQLCHLYRKAGRTKKSLETSERWKKLSPNDKQAWLTHIELLEMVKGGESALANLRRGLERFESDVDVYAKLADLYKQTSNQVQASQIYWRLYDDAKDISERIKWSGEMANLASEYGKEEELVDKFVERRRNSPKSIAPIMALSEVYRVLNRFDERRNLLLEATRLKPDDSAIFIEIADGELKQGNRQDAIAALQKAQKIDEAGVASRKLAKLYFEDNEYEKGLQELEKTAGGKKDPRDVESMVLSLVRQDAYEEAMAYLSTKLVDHPNDGRLVYLAAIIDYELGYVKKSIDSLVKILEEKVNLEGVKKGWDVASSKQNNFMPAFLGTKQPQAVKDINAAVTALERYKSILPSNNHSYGFSYFGSANQPSLPKDMESLKLMAKVTLAYELDELGKEEITLIKQRIQQAGVERIDLWQELSTSNYNRYQTNSVLKDFYLKRLDDPYYLTLALNDYFKTSQYKLPAELLKVAKVNKEKLSPEFQHKLEMCVDEKTPQKEYYELILKQCERPTNEKIKVEDFFTVLNIFGQSLYNPNQVQLEDPSVLQKLLKRFQQENPVEKDYQPNYNLAQPKQKDFLKMLSIQASLYESMLILQSKDDTKIVELFNAPEDPFKVFGNWINYNNKPSLNKVPSLFSSLNNLQKGIIQTDSNALSGIKGSFSNKKLYAKKAELNNAILRLYLGYMLKDKSIDYVKELEKIDEAKVEKEVVLDKKLFLAHLAQQRLEYSKVNNYLIEVRRLARDLILKQSIDQLLVENAQLAGKSSKFKIWKDIEKEDAKSAARRLLIGRKITNATQITKLLSQLEMESEKDRFLTKSNKSIRSQKKAVGSIYGLNRSVSQTSGSNSNVSEKAAEMLSKNQKSNAVRLLSTSLKMALKNRNNQYEARQIIKYSKEAGIDKDILAKLHPGASISPRKWLVYFSTAEAMGDKEQMKVSIDFLKNLSVTPKSVKVPLAIALLNEQPEKALSLLDDAGNVPEVMNALSQNMQIRSNAMYDSMNREPIDTSQAESYISVYRNIEKYISKLDKKHLTHHVFQNIFYKCLDGNTSRLDRMYKKIDTKKSAKLQKEIEDINHKMLHYTLYSTALADRAFSQLYGFYVKQKKLEELEKHLLTSLKEIVTEPTPYQSYYNNHNGLIEVSRADFIALQVLKKKKSIVDDEILNSLDNVDKLFADEVRFYQTHLPLSEKVLAEKLSKLNDSNYLADLFYWNGLLKLRKSEKLETQLFTSVIKAIEEEWKIHNGIQSGYGQLDGVGLDILTELINSLVSKASTRVENGEKEQLTDLISALSQKVVGEAKTNEDKLVVWLDCYSAGYSGGEVKQNYKIIELLYRAMVREPQLVKTVVNNIGKYHYPHFLNSLSVRGSYNGNRGTNPKTVNEWLEQLRASKYLSSQDEFKLESINEISTEFVKGLATNYQNLSWQLREFSNEKSVNTGLEMLCENITYSYTNSAKNQSLEDELLKKLKEIKGEERLSARLIMLLFSNYGSNVAHFCKENKKELIASTPNFKEQLVKALDLNNNIKYLAYFEKEGIAQTLPLDKEKIKAGTSKKLDNLFKIKTLISYDDFEKLDNDAVSLIQKNIKTDIKLCEKILDQYIKIIKSSPKASDKYYGSIRTVNVIDSALTRGVFEKLRDAKIYPKDLLKLIFYLHKREDAHELNVTELLKCSIPPRWVLDKSIDKRIKGATEKVIKEYAKVYSEIKDEEYKTFFKTAWLVYFSGYRYSNKRLDMSTYAGPGYVKKWKEKNEQANDFFDFIGKASMTNPQVYRNYNVIRILAKQEPRRAQLNNNFMQGIYQKVFEELKDYPLKNKLIIYNGMIDSIEAANHFRFSTVLLNDVLDTYIETIEKMPHYAHTADARYILGIRKVLDLTDKERVEKYTLACAKALELSLPKLDEGISIHENHLSNMVANVAFTKIGARELVRIIEKHPKHTKGLVILAQALVKHGYLEEAYRVLPPGGLHSIKTIHPRFKHDKKFEKYRKEFVQMYKSPNDKATIAAMMTLYDQLGANSGETTYIERVKDVIKLAQQASPQFLEGDSMLYVKKTVQASEVFSVLPSLKAFYEPLLKQYNGSNHKQFLDSLSSSKASKDFRSSIRYAAATGNVDFLLEHAKTLNKLIKKKKMSYDEGRYLIKYVGGVCAATLEMFGEREDAKLVKILPVFQEALVLKSKRAKVNNTEYVPQIFGVTKYIYAELGKSSEYEKLLKKINAQTKKRFLAASNVYALRFHADIIIHGGVYMKTRIKDIEKILIRVINNKKYQHDAMNVHLMGGVTDYLVDCNFCTEKEALEIINNPAIEIKVPEFEALLYLTKAHIAGLDNKSQDVIKYLDAARVIIEKNKVSESAKVKFHYYDVILKHYNGHKNLVPASTKEVLMPLFQRTRNKSYENFENWWNAEMQKAQEKKPVKTIEKVLEKVE